MSGTPHRNLRMFGELCGDKSARDVVLLTTMWDKVRNTEEAEKREAGLKERYWNVMIHHGATVGRFYKNDPESPWKVVDQMIQRHQLGQALLLQEEIVDLGKRLNQTQAGKALFRSLQGLLNKQNKSIRLIEEQVEEGRTDADADVQADMEALLAEAARIKEDFESMKLPLGRKIALLFKGFGKKEQAVGQPLISLGFLTDCYDCLSSDNLRNTSNVKILTARRRNVTFTNSLCICILFSTYFTDLQCEFSTYV